MSSILYGMLPRFSNQAIRSLTVSSAVVSFTAPTKEDGFVWFDVQDADVMATFDGVTNPSASVGHRLSPGEKYRVHMGDARVAKFIRQGATDARIAYSECS